MPTAAAPKKTAASGTRKAVAKKRVARPRRSAAKKVVSEVRDSEVVHTSADIKGNSSSRPSRQIESLALVTLALLFGLVGLAVHFLWIVSIVLMAMQFGLIASELGNRRGRSVISEVAEEVVTVVDEITRGSSERDDREAQEAQPEEQAQ